MSLNTILAQDFAENFNWTNSYDLFCFFERLLIKRIPITPSLEQWEVQKGKEYC